MRAYRFVSKDQEGYEHYLPILEERPGVSSALRGILIFSSGFLFGVMLVIALWVSLAERLSLAEHEEGPIRVEVASP